MAVMPFSLTLEGEMTFMSKYVSLMMETQKSIYYITSASNGWVDNSTFRECMKKCALRWCLYLNLFSGAACISSRSCMGESQVSVDGKELEEMRKRTWRRTREILKLSESS